MIKVAIADDSPFTCNLLASYLEASSECRVVGMAHDAGATLELIRTASPDVLTLDLQMPGTDGLELLRQLGETPAVSVVVISGVTRLAAATTLRALELGAVDFILKYTPGAPVSRASLRREIVSKVKIAAAARLVARPQPVTAAVPAVATAARPAKSVTRMDTGEVVIIAASTGGPRAISDLLTQLPEDFAIPSVIVQHLPADFTQAFASQLERHTRLRVKIADTGDRPEAGTILVAPGAMHLSFKQDGRVALSKPDPSDVYRPSINTAMSSAADVFGAGAIAVLLTGAGDDGADGLKKIADANGEIYVQEPETCVVASMPERAIERAGADHVASPERIGQFLAVRKAS